ncbi:hypothetical protein NLJ89_g7747 [Agrocybe chaxingu]|uniref:Uncharacterized protein n=1 Tax=Agrocybe chaxingu TaxID=84603 RepID=A0A9W8JWQ3_9AGAR|nr:hypothetical protein NLJ89_g7747 [Agrocybe chaxingu]
MAFLFSAFLVSLAGLVAKAAAQSDPFADPKNDPLNPLKYIPSTGLTAAALMLVVALLQTWCIRRWGAKWMSVMPIAAYCFALGMSFRFAFAKRPHSRPIYVLQSLFIILSPCGFIAADYILLGRIALHLNATKYLLIPARRITMVFVLSDVTTFLVQAAGGGVAAAADTPSTADLGSKIFLVGLAAQLCSFLVYTATFLLFLYRVSKYENKTWKMDENKDWANRWTTLAAALGVSCVGVLVRSVFRTVEMSEGFGGPLTTTEFWFYALDLLPLFIAIAVYVPFWPGRFITGEQPSFDAIPLSDREA